MSLAAVTDLLDWLRAPPLESWGINFPLMDMLGALRLAIVLRQVKKLKAGGLSNPDTQVSPWVTALILFGGEAIMCSLLSLTPGFLISPNIALLFMGVQYLVNEVILEPPPFRFAVELPIAVFDAFGRALLLCDFAPSLVAKHPDPIVANSPLALLITSEVLTNGGFFFVNLLNMLDLRGWRVDRTPPEVLPWGWTTIDLWSAPAITALWATLTHWRADQNESFWVDAHTSYSILTGATHQTEDEKPVIPPAWSHSDARACCIAVLAVLFVGRTWWNMGPVPSFLTKLQSARNPSSAPSSDPGSLVELVEPSGELNSVRKRRNKQSPGKSVSKVE